jgi:LmbE family N-acetylglucosaminyl deacetylase
MTQRALIRAALLVTAALHAAPLRPQSTPVAANQPWREDASGIATTARVLIIGAHLDDEDNALIAWLSLGRHVETAYLSLTRGENGVNVNRREGQMLLGMVRTAEILAERKRDQAHQYFTRAYDFGYAKNDSAVWAAWPRDSLLEDVVTVIRAFRPQVVISLFTGDTTDRDSQHHVADTLARAALALAADSVGYPATRTSALGAWSVGAFYRMADSSSASSLRIDVGEIDVERGRSYAEIGAEIRLLQRTQLIHPAPPVGPSYRYLRRDWLAADANSAKQIEASLSRSLFATDTGWTRFASLSLPDSARAALDSIAASARDDGVESNRAVDVSEHLSRMVRLATRARNSLGCGGLAAVACHGVLGDLALSLATTRDRATRALLNANGVVVDVIADRDAVAVGDSIGITASIYNGGHTPIFVSRVSVEGTGMIGFASSDSTAVPPDSVGKWRGFLKMRTTSYPWWSRTGLMLGTWMYDYTPPPRSVTKEQLIAGEDRLPSTSAFVTLRVGNAEMMTKVGPVVARNETTLRGDERRPVAAVPRLSVLLERGREYAAATSPFERLYRVWVGSSISHVDTVTVTMDLLPGLKTDSATRVVVLPAFGAKTMFFRVRGHWPIGQFPIQVSATERAERGMPPRRQPVAVTGKTPVRVNADVVTTNSGMLVFEYPHIATQRYARTATDSVQSIPVRLPPKLRVAIVRSSHDEELESRVIELGIPAYTIDASTIGIADLSYYSTLLISPRAYAEVDALLPNAAAVRQFAERGGTVVVLRGRDELSAPGILPFPIVFARSDSITAIDPLAPVRVSSPRSPLLDWPNRITSSDFADWVGSRARELPVGFDEHYRRAIEMNDDAGRPTGAAILAAHLGRGVFIYTGLSIDEQLQATNPGAARLLVNLLSAALRGP